MKKAITIVIICFPMLKLSAQDSLQHKFQIGIDLLRPVLHLAHAPSNVERKGLELCINYQHATQQAYRFGYAYRYSSEYNGPFWSLQDTAFNKHFSYHQHREHLASLGHEWQFGSKKFKASLGVDIILGYRQESSNSGFETYYPDSTVEYINWSHSMEYHWNSGYKELLDHGVSGAVALSYQLHPNLSLRLRGNVGYVSSTTIRREGTDIPKHHGLIDRIFPSIGTGVFLIFHI
ncbi:MAG: hypothetical protein M3R08_02830 [Bacteroidota bacterium]|nr:hypothetical protein [Bacteroidota bacterium]